MKRVLPLLLLLTYVGALGVSSAIYYTTTVAAGEDATFEVVVFSVTTTTADLYVNGTLISELTNTATQSTNGGPSFPPSIVSQQGAFTLHCPCHNCSGELTSPYNQYCDEEECVYPSTDLNGNQGPPSGLIPLPAVDDPVFSLFSIFAGMSENVTTPLNRTLNAGKIIKILMNGVWVNMLPTTLNFSQCYFVINSSLHSQNGSLVNETTPAFEEDPAECNYTLYVQQKATFDVALASLTAFTTKAEMESFSWMIAAYMSRRNIQACQKLVDSFLIYQTVNKTIPGDTQCHQQFGTEDWDDDPCCNYQLAYTQCCIPTSHVVRVESVVGFDSTLVNSLCSTPSSTNIVLGQYVTALERADKCDDQARGNGFDFTLWSSFTSFQTDCQTAIYGNGNPPTCTADVDCYTRCDTSRGQCVVPWDDPEPYMITCFADKMQPELYRHLLKKFNLTAAATQAEFVAAFKANMEDPSCLGPQSYAASDHWIQEDVADCTGLEDCNCVDETCVQQIHILPNQTLCMEAQQCNWSPTANSTTCNDNPNNPGTTHFCGDCHGTTCWEVTQPSSCYLWVAQTANCTALNGTLSSTSTNMCILNITTEEECTPNDLCPPAQVGSLDRWCDSFCYAPDVTTQEGCDNISSSWFTTNTGSGSGVCRVFRWDATGQTCPSPYVWHQGYTYRAGMFDTQEKCDDGMCDVDWTLNSTQCAQRGACTMPCHTCKPLTPGTTLCITNATNSSTCTGTWQSSYNICTVSLAKSACLALGYSYQGCESLNTDRSACIACEEGGSCSLYQTLLNCYSDDFDQCPDEDSCTAAGQCNDWEFQNYQNAYCQQANQTQTVNCTGACVMSYSVVGGYPHCGTGLGWSQVGCLNYSIISSSACIAAGGTWHAKAFTAAQCAAHGYGCSEKRFWGFTSKSNSTCTSCGGNYEQIYQWTSGRWIHGTMRTLSWRARSYGSINSWNNTLNWTKLNEAVDDTVASVMGKQVEATFLCKYNQLASNIKRIVCDCSGQGDSCYGTVDYVNIGQMDIFSGLRSAGTYTNTKVTVPTTAFNTSDSASINIHMVADLTPFVTPSNNNGRRLMTYRSATTDTYAVVDNHLNVVVGQLVGTGTNYTSDTDLTTVEICLDIDTSIDIDPQYDIPDLGLLNTTDSVIRPLGATATLSNNNSICADVNQTGTYFPIYRIANWVDATGTNDTNSTAASSDDVDTGMTTVDIVFTTILSTFFVLLIAGIIIWNMYHKVPRIPHIRRKRGDVTNEAEALVGTPNLRHRAVV